MMTPKWREVDTEMVGRTLCDIAQVLESSEGAEARVVGAIELLGTLVPYQQCALLEAEPGAEPRLTALPALPPEEKNGLTVALVQLHGQILEERALELEPPRIMWGAHLAVPLIGLDEVIGVLFVRRSDGHYEKRHLRVLSLVAAQLAAYLMMLRARAEEIGESPELEDARRAAESALRAKDELVSLIANQLRTPLAAAMAWVRVLGSQDLAAPERAHAVQVVERSVRTRDRLVGDLIGLSAIPAEAIRVELLSVLPAEPIEAAVEGVRPLAKERSIRLEAVLDPAVPALMADAGRLEEVLAILLSNAFKSTPDGGSIQVKLELAGAGARIQVINSGRGFGPDRLPHLFAGLESERRIQDGFGLAIAKHLIELQGGRIRAESPGEDQGATFTIELPQSPP